MRVASYLLLALLTLGCTLDHGRDRDDVNRFCREPLPLASACATAPRRERIPEGACVTEAGELLVFLSSDQPWVQCSRGDDGSVHLVDDHCAEEGAERLVYDDCGPFQPPVRAGWGTIDVADPGTCGFARSLDLAEEIPVPAPARLCSNPAWGYCGAPVLFDIELADFDPCPFSRHDQCVARRVGSEIVVELRSYVLAFDVCERYVGDRVARCAIVLDAPGEWPVRTTDGIPVGVLSVDDERGISERTCVDVP